MGQGKLKRSAKAALGGVEKGYLAFRRTTVVLQWALWRQNPEEDEVGQ